MRVFVSGAKGQLGSDCVRVLGETHETCGLDLPECDIAAADLEACIGPFRPEAIVNCAAFTDVDACESQREAARQANARGPERLAEFAVRHGILLLHVSTDYVFGGERPPPGAYTEDDEAAPTSAYGATKLEGEQAVLAAGGRCTVVRTAWLYGARGRNFPKTILRQAVSRPGEPVRVVNDQFGCPTWSARLARQLGLLVTAAKGGVYHAAGEGYCTWFDFAVYFLEQMGLDSAVQPCATLEYPTPARRPRNSILANDRLKREGLCVMEDWRADVREFVLQHGRDLRADVR